MILIVRLFPFETCATAATEQVAIEAFAEVDIVAVRFRH
jgi:hypothetical protein